MGKPSITRRSRTRAVCVCSSACGRASGRCRQTSSQPIWGSTRTRCGRTCSCSRKPGSSSPSSSTAPRRAAPGGCSSAVPEEAEAEHSLLAAALASSLEPLPGRRRDRDRCGRELGPGPRRAPRAGPRPGREPPASSAVRDACSGGAGSRRRRSRTASSCTAARSATWPSATQGRLLVPRGARSTGRSRSSVPGAVSTSLEPWVVTLDVRRPACAAQSDSLDADSAAVLRGVARAAAHRLRECRNWVGGKDRCEQPTPPPSMPRSEPHRGHHHRCVLDRGRSRRRRSRSRSSARRRGRSTRTAAGPGRAARRRGSS